MKLILFGASGMVGSGVLREALADDSITNVLLVSRRATAQTHPKVHEIILPDMFETAAAEVTIQGYDACIWALGISSVGKKEPEYAHITEHLTLLWANALLRANPTISFCYCSAQGSGGAGMWARVRRRVEGALKEMPFRHVNAVRPGFIQPGPGIRSQTRIYQIAIDVLSPIFPLIVRLFPRYATTSERLGKAMIRCVQGKAQTFILESPDINALGA